MKNIALMILGMIGLIWIIILLMGHYARAHAIREVLPQARTYVDWIARKAKFHGQLYKFTVIIIEQVKENIPPLDDRRLHIIRIRPYEDERALLWLNITVTGTGKAETHVVTICHGDNFDTEVDNYIGAFNRLFAEDGWEIHHSRGAFQPDRSSASIPLATTTAAA